MIYLLYGKDTYRAKEKQNEILETSGLKDFSRMGKEGFDSAKFEELIRSTTLFGEKRAVVCDGIAGVEHVLKNIEGLAKSTNIFVFLEEEVSEEIVDAVKKHGGKIFKFGALAGEKLQEWVNKEIKKRKLSVLPKDQMEIIRRCGPDLWCVSKEIEKAGLGGGSLQPETLETREEEYNPFRICDAVAAKDRKKAWMLLQKALLAGVPAEEVFWKIVWEVKNLMLVKKLESAGIKNIEKETGLHPFVVKKARGFSRNFSFKELSKLSWALVEIYHNSRRGLDEVETGLEKFLISI